MTEYDYWKIFPRMPKKMNEAPGQNLPSDWGPEAVLPETLRP